ncbi:unnamed protein product [Victoria cruziana]
MFSGGFKKKPDGRRFSYPEGACSPHHFQSAGWAASFFSNETLPTPTVAGQRPDAQDFLPDGKTMRMSATLTADECKEDRRNL